MHQHSAHAPLLIRLRSFAHRHDDIPAFHAAFLVWTFLAAAIFNVGFFGMLIAAHMALDIVKYRDILKMTWSKTLQAVFYESFIDITLFFVALASSIYLHHSFALSVLSGLSRAELTVMRAIALLFSKMQILEHSLHVVAHMHGYLHVPHPLLEQPMTRAQKFCGVTLACSVLLLVLSPILFAEERGELSLLLLQELLPWHL